MKKTIKNNKQEISITYLKSEKHLWVRDAHELIFELYQGKIIKLQLKKLRQHIEQLVKIVDPEIFKDA